MDDSRLIELISEEIRQTRNLTLEVREETKEVRRIADAAEKAATQKNDFLQIALIFAD